MRSSDPDFWWVVIGTVACFALLATMVKRIVFKLVRGEDEGPPAITVSETRLLPPAPAQAGPPSGPGLSPQGEASAGDDPRCLACGDVASEPMPAIERSRGARDWFRELFAMPPRYRRVVRRDIACLCRSHAHVADAMVDEFLHNRVRGAFTAAYTRVAVEAAGFEKEFLQKQLTDSLTEDQKRAAKRAGATVTRLLRTAAGAGG